MAEFDGEPVGPLGGAGTGQYADVITEARTRFAICLDAEDRQDAMDDLRFLKGDQWDADAAAARELDNRPCLTFNNIPAILHQVTNDVRQNKQSIQVAPVDSDADVKIAEVIEGLIRHIEYDSDADAAYDTALEGAARIGFGFFRLITEYESPTSFDQVMKIKRIRNPFTVHVDPNAQEADGSDMQYAFISSKMARAEFDRQYPKASSTGEGIGTATGDNATWATKEWVRIGEYYRIEYTPDTLLKLSDGKTVLKSEVGAKGLRNPNRSIVAERPTQVRKVMWYKITGAEVLEKAEIPFDWIPVFPVYGDEIDEDGQITRNGIIRNVKDPKKMENYFLTSATEEIAMRTKTPFIGALGQFEGLEADWNAANVRNFAYLEYNPVTVDGSLAPAPQRQPPADVPAGYIQMTAMMRDATKQVTGIYDASLGNRSNETSGLAIRARQAQGDIANFHFSDNLTRAIGRLAKCMISGIPRIYDTARVLRTIGEDRKTVKPVEINTPQTQQDENGRAVQTILNDLTVGTYDVTVSTGPAYNTQREETVANMMEVGGKWPKLFELAGDKLVMAMDWPGAQEIAERLKKALPPGIADDGEDQENMVQTPKGPMTGQQAGQLIQQLDQHAQEMADALEKASKGIPAKQIDAQTEIEVAKLNAASRERIAAMQVAGKHDDTELAGIIQLLVAQQGGSIGAVEAIRNHMLAIEQGAAKAAIEHDAAVAAAADPEHPDAPAPIAQGQEEAPAAVSAREAEQETPDQAPGNNAPASTGA